MRIIHFADLHLGVENYGQPDPETGLSTRLVDFLKTYDQLVDYALSWPADLVLFAGDAYKSRDPSQTQQREFAKRIARLTQAGIPVFLLVGNHDLPSALGKATALEIFPTLAVQNVYVGSRLGTQIIPTRDGPVQVVALPWIRRGAFLAREDMRGLSIEDVNRALEARVTQFLHAELETLDPSIPAVLVGHLSLSSARTSSEQSMMLGRDYVFLPSTVAHPALDYVALGHIHKHQVLHHNPPVVYSGSLQRVDFGEEKDTKGFCTVELDPQKPRGQRILGFDLVPVDARAFLTIPVDIAPDDPDPTTSVLRAIARRHVAGSIVRLHIRISQAQAPFLREAEAYAALKDAHFISPVTKEILRERRTRLGSLSHRGLSTLDALKLYLDSKSTSPQRAEELLGYAQRLISDMASEEPPS